LIKSRAIHAFGERLRKVRERRRVTLKEVADRVGVSESLVSQIERGRVSPSIDTLLAVADVLEVDLDYLFRDYKRTKRLSLVRKEQRSSMVFQGVSYHQLSTMTDPSEEHAIEAFILEIAPAGKTGNQEFGHPGKEMGIILEGEGELSYGTESYSLKEGDCVTFPSDIPHLLRNIGGETLRAIWVITPPRKFFSGGAWR
jgi:transcriptional regulator with XRE-family HTH domain